MRRALELSADPLTGRAALRRLVEAHPQLRDELASGSELLDAVVAVTVASNSLLAVLERDEAALAMLREPALRASLTVEQLLEEAHELAAAEDPPAALRRWKHRQIVRIAGRDLLGLADLRTVGSELSAVAQACLDVALAIADPGVPMAVIGMGKLGGWELNYASDVDVVFVHEGDSVEAERAARALLPRDDRADRRRHCLPNRPRPAPGGPRRRARAAASRRTTRIGNDGRRRGSAKRSSRRDPSPVTPTSVRRS